MKSLLIVLLVLLSIMQRLERIERRADKHEDVRPGQLYKYTTDDMPDTQDTQDNQDIQVKPKTNGAHILRKLQNMRKQRCVNSGMGKHCTLTQQPVSTPDAQAQPKSLADRMRFMQRLQQAQASKAQALEAQPVQAEQDQTLQVPQPDLQPDQELDQQQPLNALEDTGV